MMMSLWSVVALLSLTIASTSTTEADSTSPCGKLAIAQDAYIAEMTNDFYYLFGTDLPAEVVYECVASVPLQKNFSLQLVTEAKAWFHLESDIDYLASPPSGSVWRPLNMFAYLDSIADYIENDKYTSQYEFEVDLYTFGLHFHDFHVILRPGLFSLGRFYRNISLVSYSADGIEEPKVYLFEDLLEITPTGLVLTAQDSNVSPVIAINGLPTQEFLQTQALVALSHDPDAMYNQALVNLVYWFSTFEYPDFYPGPETVIEKEDGSVLRPSTISTFSYCNISSSTSGYEFWLMCVFEPENVKATSTLMAMQEQSTPTPTPTEIESAGAEPTDQGDTADVEALPQLMNHPPPVRIDKDEELSGYFLEDHPDVAVIVIRGFMGLSLDYVAAFQDTLEAFLQDAKDMHKTKLIIDVQGNGGGYTDLSSEFLAQLFPNIPPTQKQNMRASLPMQIVLEREGTHLDLRNQNITSEQGLLQNEAEHYFTWQSLMGADAAEFTSFEDFYGPNDLGRDGSYTQFFQSNYSNTDPSDLHQQRVQITGYGSRTMPADTPPPFNASNIVIISDGNCGSACATTVEMLVNLHSVPSIVVGGRPTTGPMQTIGNTKGSLVFTEDVLWVIFLAYWRANEFPPSLPDDVNSTVFRHFQDFGLAHGIMRFNGRNNYRIGDDTETPLQMVYSAADCRLWPTLDMLVNQTFVWNRVADIAFNSSRQEFGAGGGPYISEYCVEGSTGHSTSVTGGLKYGELGNQNPPRRAYPQYTGWLKDGKEIIQGLSLLRPDDNDTAKIVGAEGSGTETGTPVLNDDQVNVGLDEMKTICQGYSGRKWLLTLLCNRFG